MRVSSLPAVVAFLRRDQRRHGAGCAVRARPDEPRLGGEPVRSRLRRARRGARRRASTTRTPRSRRTWPSIRPTPTTSWRSGSRTAGTTAASHGNLAGYLVRRRHDVGSQRPARSRAAPAAPGDSGGYERATDPWLSFSPERPPARDHDRVRQLDALATRSWPRSRTTAAPPGARRGSCASTTRARSATTSTTRRR